ncbi:MAG: HAMP domain-containing histidine kinase [Alphaproteobacteria bacterium]|nr:HAMP domain-containing histidine kinase [Alphaproteobacteria bacterium]
MTAPDASQKTRRGVRSVAIRCVVAALALVAVAGGGLVAQRRAVEAVGEPAVVVGLAGWLGTLAAKGGLAARDLAQSPDEGQRGEARIRLAVILDEIAQQRQRLGRRTALPAEVQGAIDNFLAAGRSLVDTEAADLAERPTYRTVMDLGPERLPVLLDRLAARGEAEGRTRLELLSQIQLATAGAILIVLALAVVAIAPAIRGAAGEVRALQGEAARLTVGSAAADASRRGLSQYLLRLEQTLAAAVKTVVGLSDVLALGAAGPLNDKQREYAQRIRGDGQRLAQLLEDVHDLALIDAGQLKLDEKPIDLGPFIAQILDQMRVQADRSRIALMHSLPVDMPRLSADPSRLRQMMRRLIDIALRAGESGGQVHVRVAHEPAGGLALSVETAGQGFGHPDAEIALARTDGPGGTSALTLPLVKALAEHHGGRMTVGPAPGRGSIAILNFPPTRTIVA